METYNKSVCIAIFHDDFGEESYKEKKEAGGFHERIQRQFLLLKEKDRN